MELAESNMAKGEISWTRRDEGGQKIQVYAHRERGKWSFFIRQKRYDNWQLHENPPLEDWLELLDGVRRRAARRLIRPEEVGRLVKTIHERFPDEHLDLGASG